MAPRLNDQLGDEFVTIARFQYPSDLLFVEAELRERSIPFQVLDANTVQTAPYYSVAIGGVRLQVPLDFVDAAVPVLHELGVPAEPEQTVPTWLKWVDRFAAKLPFLQGRSDVSKRATVLIATFVLLTGIALSIAMVRKSDLVDDLASTTWWIESIEHDGTAWEPPQSGPLRLSGTYMRVIFDEGSRVQLPAADRRALQALWYSEDGMLVIFNSDTFGDVYDGVYEVSITHNALLMRSRRTTISARAHFIEFLQ